MDKGSNLTLRGPLRTPWDSALRIGDDLLRLPRPDSSEWVLLALARKAARTLKGAEALAVHQLWADAVVLGRMLFETEVQIRWLASGDTDARIAEYLKTVGADQARLEKKLRAGRSVSAKILQELRHPFTASPSPVESRPNVRELARLVDREPDYDLPYWLASAFTHSSALSISEWNEELRHLDPQLATLFGLTEDALSCWMVCAGTLAPFLQGVGEVDRCLQLQLHDALDSCQRELNEASALALGGVPVFSADPNDHVQDGEFVVRLPNGRERRYSPNP